MPRSVSFDAPTWFPDLLRGITHHGADALCIDTSKQGVQISVLGRFAATDVERELRGDPSGFDGHLSTAWRHLAERSIVRSARILVGEQDNVRVFPSDPTVTALPEPLTGRAGIMLQIAVCHRPWDLRRQSLGTWLRSQPKPSLLILMDGTTPFEALGTGI